MVTVQLAYELRNTAVKVNVVNPGFTATNRLWKKARLRPFCLALLADDGPTGGFTETGASIAW
jgi:NAD(P)-dependent dehydrogenase (short-subunit alcohol dehydrogenase family)